MGYGGEGGGKVGLGLKVNNPNKRNKKKGIQKKAPTAYLPRTPTPSGMGAKYHGLKVGLSCISMYMA